MTTRSRRSTEWSIPIPVTKRSFLYVRPEHLEPGLPRPGRPSSRHVSGERAYSTLEPPANPESNVNDRFQHSEGVYLYALGLVIIATHPARFWLGFGLAIVPLLNGPVGRGLGGGRQRGQA